MSTSKSLCDTFAVKVQNIPHTVTRNEVAALFNGFIGGVRKCEERFVGGTRSLLLVFNHRDAFKKALCMSGYTLAGKPLVVTPSSSSSEANAANQEDSRRNLYVLGIPFDFTKSDLTVLFAPYGTVSHCVILATRDSASRRRGFVVMSTHDEAKAAMHALSREQVKGNVLDVSWAVVQRSEGFLDGGDRSLQLDSTSTQDEHSGSDGLYSDTYSSLLSVKKEHSSILGISLAPTVTVLVTNLPSALFSEIVDLHPLLCPFGRIKTLRILDPRAEDISACKTSVIAEYASVSSAKEAKESLHNQFYAQYPVQVAFLQTSSPPQMVPENVAFVLNPHAPAFMRESRTSAAALSAVRTLPSNFSSQRYQNAPASFAPDMRKYPHGLGIAKPLLYASRSSSASSRLSSESLIPDKL